MRYALLGKALQASNTGLDPLPLYYQQSASTDSPDAPVRVLQAGVGARGGRVGHFYFYRKRSHWEAPPKSARTFGPSLFSECSD
jgi:hypothetical protein